MISPSVTSDSLQPFGLYPVRLLSLWDSPSKTIGVGCHALLQGIFLDPGPGMEPLSPVAPALQVDSLPAEPLGKPHVTSSALHMVNSSTLLSYKNFLSYVEGNGTPLQYSCLENSMDGGAWWAVVHGVAKSRTRLSDFTFTFPFHALEKEMATHSSIVAWRIPVTGEPGGLPSMGSHRVGHD